MSLRVLEICKKWGMTNPNDVRHWMEEVDAEMDRQFAIRLKWGKKESEAAQFGKGFHKGAESVLTNLDKYLHLKNKFSVIELQNVLNKPRLALIKNDLKNILIKGMGERYDKEEDIAFIEKYAGKKALVYQWCGNWRICEDDNYALFEDCFEFEE